MKAEQAADELTSLVMKRIGATNRNEVECPREKSFMTPCIARDGHLALADDGACVGCGSKAVSLLKAEQER
jgi:hypothetical protein